MLPTMRTGGVSRAPAALPDRNRTPRALGALVVLAAALYLPQLATPLRLNKDAIVYLSLASSLADGTGLLYEGMPSHYPPGLPAIYAGMESVGLGTAPAVVGLNLFLLTVGLAGFYAIARWSLALGRERVLLACAATLLSFVVVKHAAMPLSDVPYLGLSALSLLALLWAERQRGRVFWLGMAGAACLAAVAISVRSIGVALIPALLWALPPRRAVVDRAGALLRRRTVLLGIVPLAAAGLMVGYRMMEGTLYVQAALRVFERFGGVPQAAAAILGFRLTELGEVAVNVPHNRLPGALGAALPLLGAVLLAGLLYGLWRRRRAWSPVDLYVLAYVGILFVWPFFDARFWIPLVPLLVGYLFIATEGVRLPGVLAHTPRLYRALFVLAGVAALAYSTRIALLPAEEFPEQYGDGILRPTYRAAFTGGPTDPAELHLPALRVLRRYDPHARRRW